MQYECKKVGILGGTFNPIHIGHLIIAEQVRELFAFDSILFMPSGMPPHKDVSQVIDTEHRINMVKLALESNPNFKLSTIEAERKGYTYTIDTLNELNKKYESKVEFSFIIGADNVSELVTWRDYQQLFKMCRFIATYRPGYEVGKITSLIKELEEKYDAKIELVSTPLIEVSATCIRNRVKENKSIKYLVPEKVEEYIIKNKLYR